MSKEEELHCYYSGLPSPSAYQEKNKNMEMIEFNRRCAEFLCWVKYNGINPEWNDSYDTNEIYFGEKTVHLRYMKFHSDWNWIMEVVEKIKSIDDNQEDWFGDEWYRIQFVIDLMNGVEIRINSERIFMMTAFGEGQMLGSIVEAVNCFLEWFDEKVKKS